MKRRFEVWRRQFWTWSLALAFCLLNLAGLGAYQLRFAGQVEGLQENAAAARQELAALENERRTTEKFLDRAAANRENIELLYQEEFSTQAERFTRAVQEVKRLAQEAGLNPTAFSYPEQDLGAYGLRERGFVFSVEGTYDQLRTYVNFLELSDHFLTLERVSLSGASDDRREPKLRINLTVTTVFGPREQVQGGTSS